MDDLQFEEAGHLPMPNSMQKHLQMKLGKPSDIQKTPSRGGLGMIVNESKTPGARSLQSLASSRKPPSSVIKSTVPLNIGFEIFQDDVEEEVAEEQIQIRKEIEKAPCSPIDTANRCPDSDSLGGDIADDMLNWPDQDVILHEEQPLGNFIDPKVAEDEALAELGVEAWDEYPPIDPASRIADDYNYTISLDDFKHEDVDLVESDYGNVWNKECRMEKTFWDHEEMQSASEKLLQLAEEFDDDDLLAEEAAIPI